ncbi:hypothetical protein [Aliarcobacter trophiarum]|uniref:hypothetical protein n=1 Tax=Aliarcobacter trophiarum TaxID=708186 RepID=UPI00100AF27A|nr:hypothetical protein [Aliarcobacter trophiarum]RXI27662.1 hypothetical protein CRU89_05130 [Aliarcobacter trophiarum]
MSKIKVITINLYKKNKIKFDDILSNENIDSEKFNSFMYGQGCTVIDKIIYVSIIDFERFCYINKLSIEYLDK